jgi:hypothetical protein
VLTVTSISSANAQFSVTTPAPIPFDVPAGWHQNLTVRFAPSVAGAQQATLRISSNDPNRPVVEVALAGSARPRIDALNPVRGLIGAIVKLTGAGFDPVATNNVVYIGIRQAFVVSANAAGTELVVLVPADLPPGAVPVTVTVLGQTSDPANFDVLATLATISVWPLAVDFGTLSAGQSRDQTLIIRNLGIRGENVGQDLYLQVDLFVPTDASNRISQAGPFLRDRASAAGDGIIGGQPWDPNGGYWIQLHSTGEIKVMRLYPKAIVAFTGRVAGFDNTVFHRLEVAAQGTNLQVVLDGRLQTFSQDGKLVTIVGIPDTGIGNHGTVGISFGCEDNRGQIGGQQADNLVVGTFRPLDSVLAPRLNINRLAIHAVLSWPTSATGFVLQRTLNLTPPVTWTVVTNMPVAVADQYSVQVNLLGGNEFFRLVK